MVYLKLSDEKIAKKVEEQFGKDKVEASGDTVQVKASSLEEEKSIVNSIFDICRDYECSCEIMY